MESIKQLPGVSVVNIQGFLIFAIGVKPYMRLTPDSSAIICPNRSALRVRGGCVRRWEGAGHPPALRSSPSHCSWA